MTCPEVTQMMQRLIWICCSPQRQQMSFGVRAGAMGPLPFPLALSA